MFQSETWTLVFKIKTVFLSQNRGYENTIKKFWTNRIL